MSHDKKIVIFSDLDGTLLNQKYSFEKARPALKKVKEKRIPLVLCSSKTRAELEVYRKKLKNKEPFISENGGAIFIPKNYFDFPFKFHIEKEGYCIIRIGTPYSKLVEVMKKLKKKFRIRSYFEMSAEELSKDSRLSLREAKLAKKREYDEPFKFLEPKKVLKLKFEIKKYGLKCVFGGRYFHLTGDNDKGKATRILTEFYKKKFNKLKTVGIGNSQGDIKMLEFTDASFFVQKEDGKWIKHKKSEKVRGVGPEGWNKIILKIINGGRNK